MTCDAIWRASEHQVYDWKVGGPQTCCWCCFHSNVQVVYDDINAC